MILRINKRRCKTNGIKESIFYSSFSVDKINIMKYRIYWLPGFISKICIYLFFFNLLVLILFLLGNFQEFLDSTQVLLLEILKISALLFIIFIGYYACMILYFTVRSKRLHFFRLIISLGGFLLGVFLFFLASFILSL
ncbi:MAG: hypothetical protein DRP87_19335 [Spirochaetes bacterium]|nr:MAG: hypothetical protein DRP87_19335 [Spirochaetota bacterium]